MLASIRSKNLVQLVSSLAIMPLQILLLEHMWVCFDLCKTLDSLQAQHCCHTTVQDADGSKNSSLPQVLGDMCDSMWLPSEGSQDEAVCQGFAYDTQNETFTFFGQLQTQPIVLTNETTCNRPTSLLWILNAGMPSVPPSPAPLALYLGLPDCSLL